VNHIHKRGHKLRYFLLLLVGILLYYLITESEVVQHYLANPEALRTLILGFGILAPLAIIILQAFQTTISIIPSQITTIVAGFIFGPFLGVVYSLIGAFFGSAIIFLISRKYGKDLALKFFDKKEIVHFNHFFKQKKLWALFLARITPIFPNDLVSFAAGLTTIRLRDFNLVSSLGFIVQMIILSYFGSELATGKFSWPLVIISILVVLLFLVVVFKSKIKKIVIKDLHIIEREIDKEFKKIEKWSKVL